MLATAIAYLAASVGKDDGLSNGQCLIQVTQSVQLPLLLLNVDVELQTGKRANHTVGFTDCGPLLCLHNYTSSMVCPT